MFTASGPGFIIAGNKQRYTVATQTHFKVKEEDCSVGPLPELKARGKNAERKEGETIHFGETLTQHSTYIQPRNLKNKTFF